MLGRSTLAHAYQTSRAKLRHDFYFEPFLVQDWTLSCKGSPISEAWKSQSFGKLGRSPDGREVRVQGQGREDKVHEAYPGEREEPAQTDLQTWPKRQNQR